MVDWMSMNNDVASAWEMSKSYEILRNQTISHAASHAEMYSASAELSATDLCFLLYQENAVNQH